MADIFLFAGTIEGKELAEALCKAGISVHAFTATEYGGALLEAGAGETDAEGTDTTAGDASLLTVTSERLDEKQMLVLMQEEKPRLVIDATHPYAVVVSDNIRLAAQEAALDLIRLQRQESETVMDLAGRQSEADEQRTSSGKVVHVASAKEAAEFLANTTGNVLLTCGSKELPEFTGLDDYKARLFARVLSTENVVHECTELGFSGKHLIAMQGPFSLEMNRALIRHIDAAWLVTKESGVQGGFPEKAQAAAAEGIGLLIIDRPENAQVLKNITLAGYSEKYMVCDTVSSCLKEVYQVFGITPKKKFTLLGIGPGSAGGLTIEGKQALEEADVVFGATRMLEILDKTGLQKPTFKSWKPAEMKQFTDENPQYQNVVVALSGDTGFYSGAAKLLEVWKDEDVVVLPGLSTMQVLCAKAKTDWQHVYCMSRHGRAGNLLSSLRTQEALFLLPGETLPELCEKLIEGGYENVLLAVGSKLSYEDEKVLVGTPVELRNETCAEPYAVLIKNPAGQNAVVTPGIPDADFLRVMAGTKQTEAKAEQPEAGQKTAKPKRTVPMTKEEIRTVSLAKLRLSKNAVVYDIGAGTGSVSVEAARMAYAGTVYAIEQNPTAVALLHENKKKFALDNMEIIEGLAPEAMADLPAPTHAFIGGSKGNLKAIVEMLMEKNPNVRIVINTVTVETEMEAREVLDDLEQKATGSETDTGDGVRKATGFQSEVIRLSVTREERVGRYHMQRAENPIAIVSFGGRKS